MRQPVHSEPDHRVPFTLTVRERDLIVERTLISAELERRLRLAARSGSRLVIRLTADDIDELAGAVAAEANHCTNQKMRRELDGVHERLARLENEYTDHDTGAQPFGRAVTPAKTYTAKQGQYLAFIHYYTKIHRIPPAEADLQRYFCVSAPAVHQMILTLEARGFIARMPGQARSIRVRLSRSELPDLD